MLYGTNIANLVADSFMLRFCSFNPKPKRFTPAEHSRRRPSESARAYTLLELMVVVIIIGILTTIAVPAIAGRLANNRARTVAQEISALYRNAKMRAAGRGSAVLVRYIESTRTFEVREAVVGTTNATADFSEADCAALPESSCNPVARWAVTSDQNLLLEQYAYPTDSEFAVSIESPSGSSQNYDICYTPIGIAKGREATTATTLFSNMSGALSVNVALSSGQGLERRVIVTPNGMARVIIP